MRAHFCIEYEHPTNGPVESFSDFDLSELSLRDALWNEYVDALKFDKNAKLTFGGVCECFPIEKR